MTLEQEFEINNYLLSKIQQKIGILGLGIGYYFIISKVPGIYIILFHGEIKNCFAKNTYAVQKQYIISSQLSNSRTVRVNISI